MDLRTEGLGDRIKLEKSGESQNEEVGVSSKLLVQLNDFALASSFSEIQSKADL